MTSTALVVPNQRSPKKSSRTRARELAQLLHNATWAMAEAQIVGFQAALEILNDRLYLELEDKSGKPYTSPIDFVRDYVGDSLSGKRELRVQLVKAIARIDDWRYYRWSIGHALGVGEKQIGYDLGVFDAPMRRSYKYELWAEQQAHWKTRHELWEIQSQLRAIEAAPPPPTDKQLSHRVAQLEDMVARRDEQIKNLKAKQRKELSELRRERTNFRIRMERLEDKLERLISRDETRKQRRATKKERSIVLQNASYKCQYPKHNELHGLSEETPIKRQSAHTLFVDHIDAEDPDRHDLTKMQVLCGCCHGHKTYMER